MNRDATNSRSNTVEIMRIMEMIPHRYPFLMIDRIIEAVPDAHVIAVKNVSINEPYFQGHFPARPVMPGVLIIESMAQTAAVLVVKTLGTSAEGKLVYFTAIDSARFRKPITPGDTVFVRVEKRRRRGNLWQFAGEARVDGTRMADATFAAMIMES